MHSRDLPVLIVGAGVAGLTLALELRRRGVQCRIVDRADGPQTTSRALSVHTRTLELYEIAGVVERLLSRGLRHYSMDYYFEDGSQRTRLDFTVQDVRYPFFLTISQTDVEAVLRDRLADLGTEVEWGTSLTALTENADGMVRAELSGCAAEQVEADWLVGSDGVRSTVRDLLRLPYASVDYTGMVLRMMDVPLANFPSCDDRSHYWVSEDQMLLIAKLPGRNHRLVLSGLASAQAHLTAGQDRIRELFQEALWRHVGERVSMGVPEWDTVFRISRSVIPTYQKGHVLLAGDAAHTHSPAGGQGLNICIQDAFNLGWKLALACRGQAGDDLIGSYGRERRPAAQRVIDASHALHSVLMDYSVPVPDRAARSRDPEFIRWAVTTISGLAYNYRDVALVPELTAPLAGLQAGDRIPDCRITAQLRLYDVLRHPRHTLLLLPPASLAEPIGPEPLGELATEIAARYPRQVETFLVVPPGGRAAANGYPLACDDDALLDAYADPHTETFFLVRPDAYLAARGRICDVDALWAVFARTFAPARVAAR